MVKRRSSTTKATATEAPVEQTTTASVSDSIGGTFGSLDFGFGSNNISASTMKIGNKQLTELTEKLKVILSDDQEVDNIRIIKIDRNRYGTAFSLICVVHSVKGEDGPVHSTYPIMIEATGDFTSPDLGSINTNAIFQQQNRRPELMRVPSDAFDNVLSSIVTEVVNKTAGVGDVLLLDGCVLPKEYDTEDEEHVRTLAAIAINAVVSMSMKALGKETAELNLATEIKRLPPDVSLEYDVMTDRGVVHDELERPMYYNWVVSLNMRSRGNQVRSLNETNADRLLTRTIGFTDVVPTVQNIPGAAGTMVQATRFIPHIVINHMLNVVTDGWAMLNLLSALIIKDKAVRETLMPSKDDKLHDPGVMNILANLENDPKGQGKPLDFFAPGMTQFDINNALSQLLVPGAAISIDIDAFGPTTWAMTRFLQAGTNSPRAEQARSGIIAAAHHLTNKKFPLNFPENPVAAVVRLPRGYWEDGNGQRRDLREFGVLGAMNQLRDDPQAAMEFVAALTAPGVGNLVNEAKIIETYKRFGLSATITGYTFRVMLNSAFVTTLSNAVTQAGFHAMLDAPQFEQGNIGFQDVTQYMSSAVVGQDVAAGFANPRGATAINGAYNAPGSWY